MLAAGNLMGAAAGIGQQLQKQIGQTGIPVYNVANACATGATALRVADHGDQGGRGRHGPGRRRREAGRRRPAGRREPQAATTTPGRPTGRYGAVAPVDGRIGTETMPGVFAQIGMEYGHRYGGTSFELFAKISEKNHAHSTLNPLAAYTKKMTLERDHERRHDRLPEHPADVLGQLRRGGRGRGRVSDAKLKTLVARAAAPGGEDRRPRSSPPTRGRRRARSCPTSTP